MIMMLIILIVLSLVIAFLPMDHSLKVVLSVVLIVMALLLLFGVAPVGVPLLR